MAHHATHPTRKLLVLAVVILLLLFWFVGFAAGDTVILRAEASLDPASEHVRLGDIADLEGVYAEALRELVIVPAERMNANQAKIQLADIRENLSRQGVNLGLISLKGHAVCSVRRADDATGTSMGTPTLSTTNQGKENDTIIPSHSDGSVAAVLDQPIDAADPTTVRGLIRQTLLTGLDVPDGKIEIVYQDNDAALLNQSTLGVKFKITPVGQPRLGTINVRVKRLAGWGDPEEQVVTVRVLWHTQVVVAARPIAKQQRLSGTNLALQQVVLDRPPSTELFSLDEARGAVSASTIRAGDPVRREHLGQPMLVRRGQPVTLTIYRDGFTMATSAFAAEDAARGQRVSVRLGQRQTRDTTILSGVVTGPDQVSIGHAPHADPDIAAAADQVADASLSPSAQY